MNARRLSHPDASTDPRVVPTPTGSVAKRRAVAGPEPTRAPVAARSREEAEARYTAAHDAWIQAMHRASSGRHADLASLAIAQEDFEAATAERALWSTGHRVAVPIVDDRTRAGIQAVVGQELAWRKVRDADHRHRGFLARLVRRVTRRA